MAIYGRWKKFMKIRLIIWQCMVASAFLVELAASYPQNIGGVPEDGIVLSDEGKLRAVQPKNQFTPYYLGTRMEGPCPRVRQGPLYAKATCTTMPGKVVCRLGQYTFIINNGDHKMEPEVIERFAAMLYHRAQEGDRKFDVSVDTPNKEEENDSCLEERPDQLEEQRKRQPSLAEQLPVFVECTPIRDERKMCRPSFTPSEVIYSCRRHTLGLGRRRRRRSVIEVDSTGGVSDGLLRLPYRRSLETFKKSEKGFPMNTGSLQTEGMETPGVRETAVVLQSYENPDKKTGQELVSKVNEPNSAKEPDPKVYKDSVENKDFKIINEAAGTQYSSKTNNKDIKITENQNVVYPGINSVMGRNENMESQNFTIDIKNPFAHGDLDFSNTKSIENLKTVPQKVKELKTNSLIVKPLQHNPGGWIEHKINLPQSFLTASENGASFRTQFDNTDIKNLLVNPTEEQKNVKFNIGIVHIVAHPKVVPKISANEHETNGAIQSSVDESLLISKKLDHDNSKLTEKHSNGHVETVQKPERPLVVKEPGEIKLWLEDSSEALKKVYAQPQIAEKTIEIVKNRGSSSKIEGEDPKNRNANIIKSPQIADDNVQTSANNLVGNGSPQTTVFHVNPQQIATIEKPSQRAIEPGQPSNIIVKEETVTMAATNNESAKQSAQNLVVNGTPQTAAVNLTQQSATHEKPSDSTGVEGQPNIINKEEIGRLGGTYSTSKPPEIPNGTTDLTNNLVQVPGQEQWNGESQAKSEQLQKTFEISTKTEDVGHNANPIVNTENGKTEKLTKSVNHPSNKTDDKSGKNSPQTLVMTVNSNKAGIYNNSRIIENNSSIQSEFLQAGTLVNSAELLANSSGSQMKADLYDTIEEEVEEPESGRVLNSGIEEEDTGNPRIDGDSEIGTGNPRIAGNPEFNAGNSADDEKFEEDQNNLEEEYSAGDGDLLSVDSSNNNLQGDASSDQMNSMIDNQGNGRDSRSVDSNLGQSLDEGIQEEEAEDSEGDSRDKDTAGVYNPAYGMPVVRDFTDICTDQAPTNMPWCPTLLKVVSCPVEGCVTVCEDNIPKKWCGPGSLRRKRRGRRRAASTSPRSPSQEEEEEEKEVEEDKEVEVGSGARWRRQQVLASAGKVRNKMYNPGSLLHN